MSGSTIRWALPVAVVLLGIVWVALLRNQNQNQNQNHALASDPKVALEQSIRDMTQTVPELNIGIAKSLAAIIRLDKDAAQNKLDISKLRARVRTCLQNNDEARAGHYAVQLKMQQDALARRQTESECVKGGVDVLLKAKDRYMREMKLKTEESLRAIPDPESSKWRSDLASVFESFKTPEAPHSDNPDANVANEDVDMKTIQLEEKAEQLAGQELLKQFQAK